MNSVILENCKDEHDSVILRNILFSELVVETNNHTDIILSKQSKNEVQKVIAKNASNCNGFSFVTKDGITFSFN